MVPGHVFRLTKIKTNSLHSLQWSKSKTHAQNTLGLYPKTKKIGFGFWVYTQTLMGRIFWHHKKIDFTVLYRSCSIPVHLLFRSLTVPAPLHIKGW